MSSKLANVSISEGAPPSPTPSIMYEKSIVSPENEADEDINHQQQDHADKPRAWTVSKAESLQSWFTNQGLGHLWSGSAAKSEETLLLLASEKQWDDVREICSQQLNVPTVQIGYLKAYLIDKVNSRANSTKQVNPHSSDSWPKADLINKLKHEQKPTVSSAVLASTFATLRTNVRNQQQNVNLHLARFICLSIFTLIIMIVSVAGNNLSFWSEQRSCSNAECAINGSEGGCNPYCAAYDHEEKTFEYYPICKANGQCGWRTGKTSWTQPSPSISICPSCGSADSCVYSESIYEETDWGVNMHGPVVGMNWESKYNFKTLCNDYDDEAACLAMRIGNDYMAFNVCAIVLNAFALYLMVFFYCKGRSIFNVVCGFSFFHDETHIFLGILYCLTTICNLIAVVVWMAAGVCDNSDPNHEIVFIQDTTNYPGYSLYGLMICVVANVIGFCSACCVRRTDQQSTKESDPKKSNLQDANNDEMNLSSAKNNVEVPRPMELPQVQAEAVEHVAPGQLVGSYPCPAVLEDLEPGMLLQPQQGMKEQPPNDDLTYR